jgi:hypothetical protein
VCAAAIGSLSLNTRRATALDYFGEPPKTDPSAYTQEPADIAGALLNLLSLPETNVGGREGAHGILSKRQVEAENVLPPGTQTSFNYPTNGYPSPMWGAQPFTQKLLMFEEFGPEKLDPSQSAGNMPFPSPKLGPAPEQDGSVVSRSAPPSGDLDNFLKQTGLSPFPMRQSNTGMANPWKPEIEMFLERFLANAPAEGRPPGEGWAHQRWNEFYPQNFFKTVQAGARVNGGIRDNKQLHQYKIGEFGPGGLYYNTADNNNPAFNGTT